MIDGIDVKILAQRDLVLALRQFKDKTAIGATKTAAKKVAEFLERALRAEAPNFTGRLRFNLFVRAKYVKRRGVVRSTVAIRTEGKAGNARNAFYWRFLEFGHMTRPSKDENKPRRKVPANNFIERVYLASQTQAQAIFFRELESAINRAAKNGKNFN